MINEINKAWGWIGFEAEKVLLTNDFGNVIFRSVDKKFWRLIPEELTCVVIAENEEQLNSLFLDPEFRLDWEMQSLVEMAKSKLGELEGIKKFYFIKPNVIGGEYDIRNMASINHKTLINISGNMAYQIKDLPDGAEIELVFNSKK